MLEVASSALVLGGHSGDELLALLASTTVEPTWYDGRSEALTIAATGLGGPVEVVEAANPDPQCWEWLAMDVHFDLSSADGTVAASWEQEMMYGLLLPWGEVAFGVGIPVEDLAGTLDFQALLPDATHLEQFTRIGGDGTYGNLDLVNTNADSGGTMPARLEIAAWDER